MCSKPDKIDVPIPFLCRIRLHLYSKPKLVGRVAGKRLMWVYKCFRCPTKHFIFTN